MYVLYIITMPVKPVSLKDKHVDYIESHAISLSKYVQMKIEEDMKYELHHNKDNGNRDCSVCCDDNSYQS